jgi:hypothetical protein
MPPAALVWHNNGCVQTRTAADKRQRKAMQDTYKYCRQLLRAFTPAMSVDPMKRQVQGHPWAAVLHVVPAQYVQPTRRHASVPDLQQQPAWLHACMATFIRGQNCRCVQEGTLGDVAIYPACAHLALSRR